MPPQGVNRLHHLKLKHHTRLHATCQALRWHDGLLHHGHRTAAYHMSKSKLHDALANSEQKVYSNVHEELSTELLKVQATETLKYEQTLRATETRLNTELFSLVGETILREEQSVHDELETIASVAPARDVVLANRHLSISQKVQYSRFPAICAVNGVGQKTYSLLTTAIIGSMKRRNRVALTLARWTPDAVKSQCEIVHVPAVRNSEAVRARHTRHLVLMSKSVGCNSLVKIRDGSGLCKEVSCVPGEDEKHVLNVPPSSGTLIISIDPAVGFDEQDSINLTVFVDGMDAKHMQPVLLDNTVRDVVSLRNALEKTLDGVDVSLIEWAMEKRPSWDGRTVGGVKQCAHIELVEVE